MLRLAAVQSSVLNKAGNLATQRSVVQSSILQINSHSKASAIKHTRKIWIAKDLTEHVHSAASSQEYFTFSLKLRLDLSNLKLAVKCLHCAEELVYMFM